MSHKKRGFTLLELVIVIVIIGVLASLALPRMFSVVEKARAAEAWSFIASIRRTAERCILMNNNNLNPCGNLSVIGFADQLTITQGFFATILWWGEGLIVYGQGIKKIGSKAVLA